MYKIVLIRHGESIWNQQDLFTGWTDVDLSENGMQEAIKAGQLLKENNFSFDITFTSMLKRAIKTLHIVMEEINQLWLPEIKSFKLNERHYGALQGLNKKETAQKYGDDQVFVWRRSYDVPPPLLEISDERNPQKDPRYAHIDPNVLPLGESLKDTYERVIPYWNNTILPHVIANEKVLITAHGNSLRALAKYLEKLDEQEITQMNIPTGSPLVYELSKDLIVTNKYYLQ